jgi:hypothetical protein
MKNLRIDIENNLTNLRVIEHILNKAIQSGQLRDNYLLEKWKILDELAGKYDGSEISDPEDYKLFCQTSKEIIDRLPDSSKSDFIPSRHRDR